MLRPTCLFAVVLTCWANLVLGETNYVIDQLLVGVHEQKSLDSAIIKVLPTGTRLEVLERDGEIALIEDGEGVRGWVDASYLTAELPIALRITELERDKATLEARIKTLLTANDGDAAGGSTAQVDVLTQENTELKAKLSTERLRAGKLQSEVASLRSSVQSTRTSPDARIVELERSRSELERQLGDAKDEIGELSARSSLKATSEMIPLIFREYLLSIIIGFLIIVALSFGAGIYVVDLLNRRRHGGFRV